MNGTNTTDTKSLVQQKMKRGVVCCRGKDTCLAPRLLKTLVWLVEGFEGVCMCACVHTCMCPCVCVYTFLSFGLFNLLQNNKQKIDCFNCRAKKVMLFKTKQKHYSISTLCSKLSKMKENSTFSI